MPAPAQYQVKFIFGYNSRPNPANTPFLTLPAISFPRHNPIHEQLGDLFGSTWTPYFKWREFVMGACWLIILFSMRWAGNRYKCVALQLLQAAVKCLPAPELHKHAGYWAYRADA